MQNNGLQLILASGSPQRAALLTEAGYVFEVIVPSDRAECGVCSSETPPQLVARLACQKAADVAGRRTAGLDRPAKKLEAESSRRIIVACDTLCECQAQVLGKPRDERHARRMLELLSGREHHVYSGLCLWPIGGDSISEKAQTHVRVATTRLRMDALSAEQIDEYLNSGLWKGKAGAFGYQDRLDWLQIVEGSESNVIGLPLELLAEMLASLGGQPTEAE